MRPPPVPPRVHPTGGSRARHPAYLQREQRDAALPAMLWRLEAEGTRLGRLRGGCSQVVVLASWIQITMAFTSITRLVNGRSGMHVFGRSEYSRGRLRFFSTSR